MRGATNLQRTLRALAERHAVMLAQPRRVPLTSQPDHPTTILEGVASTSDIDIDRVRFAPFCFGSQLPTVPLLIEHDAARSAGQITPTYDSAGGLRVRTSPLSGEAARYGAFSIAVRNIQFDIRDADSRHFHAAIISAELTEISLTEYPHLPTAVVATRMRPCARAEFYSHAIQHIEVLKKYVALIQKEVHHVVP